MIEIRYNNKIRMADFDKKLSEQTIQDTVDRFVEHLEMLTKRSPDEVEWIWCLIGNVVEEHIFGEQKEIRKGTKQFPPGAKLYIFPSQWDTFHGSTIVIGKPRKQNRLIKIVTRMEYITNWRIQKVYDPFVIKEMILNFGWDDSEKSLKEINELIEASKH